MRVVTNERLVASRAKLGRRASLIGMLILLAGLVISFYPNLFYLSLLFLIVGFIVSNIGVHNANLWVKEPRADQALEKGMKGFSNKFTLFNYTGPVSHVVVGPPGLIVFVAKPQEGKVVVREDSFKQPFSWRRLIGFFGLEPLGRPQRELETAERTAQEAAKDVLQLDTEIPVYGAIVFTAPAADLDVQNATVDVLTPEQLKNYMRNLPKEEVLSPEQRRQLMDAFQGTYEPHEESEE